MQIEHELKFLSPAREIIIDKLLTLGGKRLKGKHLLRRCVFYIPNEPGDRFIRLRDDGDCVTLTYKQRSATAVHEIEVKVESFEKTAELLQCMKMIYSSYSRELPRVIYLGASSDYL